MRESLGARLRRRREEQGVRLSTIADHTKIKLSLLDGLERDDVSHWPTGIFRRAYIRAYAQAINLDPDAVVREFVKAYPEPQEEFETALAAALSAGGRSAPPTRLRNLVGSALESLSRFRKPPAAGYQATAEPDPEVPAMPLDFATVHPPQLLAAVEMADDSSALAFADELEEVAVIEPSEKPEPQVPALPAPPDLAGIARVCTALGQVDDSDNLQRHLDDAAQVLGALGLIVWIWDAAAEGLRPALAHGYSPRVLAQLPTVRRDDDNATATAFRSEAVCTMSGGPHSSGALVVPLLAPCGCAGVLALELAPDAEQQPGVRAAASIIAAALAQLVARSTPIEPETAQPIEIRLAGRG
jgi:transcriptional regulator with XRE-family HTH domain